MSVRFSDTDRGAAAMVRRIGSIKGVNVDVGVLGERAARSDEGGQATVGDVATWAEFGTENQPARSWCREWVDENGDKVQRLARRACDVIAKDGVSTEQAALALGLGIAGSMQERISNGIVPANAPSTIARKGSSTPLVDKGQFRSSIAPRVVK